MNWFYGLGIFITGILTGFAWGNNASSQYEVKQRLRQRIFELEVELEKREIERDQEDEVDGLIERITDEEQVEYLEQMWRTSWHRIE